METNNKYYTPSIEEFNIGFEYESKWEVSENGTTHFEWRKEVCSLNFPDPTLPIIKQVLDNNPDDIRVKYLDKSDIESLGFTHIGSMWFEKNDCRNVSSDNRSDCRIRWWKDCEVDIYVWNRDKEDGTGDIIFRGKIKNKSELKKILSMVL